MPAPYNYNLNVQSPIQAAVQGLQLGASIDSIRQQKQQQIQEQMQRQRQAEILGALMSKKDATAEDYKNATLALPGMKDVLKQSWEMHSEDEKKSSLAEIGEVYSALTTGNPDIAVKMLERRVEALQNSGGDKKQIDAAKTMAELIKINPDVARVQTGIRLASIPDGDKIIKGVSDLAGIRLKEQMQPGEIEKQAADLGLTRANINKVLAETRKLGDESRKAALELESMKKTGGIKPEKVFEQEEKLRKEYTSRTAVFRESRDAYNKIDISSKDNTGASDIALVTSFMKMLDPGSVVRETEFATARDTAGLFERLKNQAKKLERGSFLDDSQRKSFAALAKKYMGAAEDQEKRVRASLERVVNNYSLNPDNVFEDIENVSRETNRQGWRLMEDASGNRAYVSPDGTQFEEVK